MQPLIYRLSRPRTNVEYAAEAKRVHKVMGDLGYHREAIWIHAGQRLGYGREQLTEWARDYKERRGIEAAWRWLNRHPIGADLDEEMQLTHLRNQISFEGWFQAAPPSAHARRNSRRKNISTAASAD